MFAISKDKSKCYGCGTPAISGSLEAMGRVYHTACFKCAGCKALLSEMSEGFVAPKGEPVCVACSKIIRQRDLEEKARAAGNVCAGCSAPIISGSIMKMSGSIWHPGILLRFFIILFIHLFINQYFIRLCQMLYL